MSKGKYAQRADSRLRVLESETVRDANAKIAELKDQLAHANQELHEVKAEISSKAMQAAQHLSSREKTYLRNKLASVEQQARDDRKKFAIQTWELMHRNKFGEPAPQPEAYTPKCNDEWYRYWLDVKWLLLPIFCPTYYEAEEVLDEIEGPWDLAGFDGRSKRENTRLLRKGALRKYLARRHEVIRKYWQSVYTGRQTNSPVPVKTLVDWRNSDDADWQETRMKEIKVSQGGGPVSG
jgi:hypothetical protein